VIVRKVAAPSLVVGWSYFAGYQNILEAACCPSAYDFEWNLFLTTNEELKVPSSMGYKLMCLINLRIHSA
jgi:hypothetical protein